MSGGRRCVEVPVIEIGKDAEDKTRRQAVDDLFLFKAGRWRAMRRWRDQRKADYFHLGRGIFRRINAASPSASAPLRPPPSLHLCGSQLEYASQSENSTFEPSQSTFEQAPTPKEREEIAARIKAKREQAGLSQSEAARAWGISKQTLQSWEQGRRAPRGLYLQAIERILEKSAVRRK